MTINQREACLTKDSMERLALGELPAAELAQLEEHIGSCERCRHMLESASLDSQWNDEVLPVLRTLSDANGFLDELEEGGHDEQSLESLLKLLGPTDDPRKLGRIGTYEVTGVIGRGGMGVVFKAFDAALNRFVAIKMLLPHLAISGAARKRFAREGQAAAAVIDDNVLPIYSVAEWRGVPYLVTQYSRGMTLQKRIQDQGPLELKEILRIGMQTARGLAAAHAQGLVHRDVKPSNILLDGTVERALLTDFGLARAVDDASITRTGVIAGTPQYMSPEQARGGSVDARSDLFGLGCVLYTMCTGRPPFRAENSYAVLRLITDADPRSIREINPEIPEWLCGLISRLMAKSPHDRFASASEVTDLLQSCLAHVQQPTVAPLPEQLRITQSANERRNIGRWIAAIGAKLISLTSVPLNKSNKDSPMSDASVANAPSSKRSPLSTRIIVCVILSMIGIAMLAWEYLSSGFNAPPLRWLFPGAPFVILAGLTFVKRVPLGTLIGACVGGLVPVAVLYRAIWLSSVNYNGGGADIGLGLLGLATLVLMPFSMLIGGFIGWLVPTRTHCS
jgi:serine/threonine protein kinase